MLTTHRTEVEGLAGSDKHAKISDSRATSGVRAANRQPGEKPRRVGDHPNLACRGTAGVSSSSDAGNLMIHSMPSVCRFSCADPRNMLGTILSMSSEPNPFLS